LTMRLANLPIRESLKRMKEAFNKIKMSFL